MSNGGGFMSGSQGGSQGDSPSSVKRGPQPVRPVTIHQVNNAEQNHPDVPWAIDGVDVDVVTFVACVRNVNVAPTMSSYLVEDGTGQIDVREWHQNADDDAPSEPFKVNSYIRINGSIKTFQGKKSIISIAVMDAPDFHEVLFHTIEAVHTHLSLTKTKRSGGGMNEDRKPNVRNNATNPYGAQATSNDDTSAFAGLLAPQRKIMEYIMSQHHAGLIHGDGVNVNAMHRASGAGATLAAFKEQVGVLIDEGHLYSTCDDDHVLLTTV